jgi:hypothetical protein
MCGRRSRGRPPEFPNIKERLLAVASDLFYRCGVRAVSVAEKLVGCRSRFSTLKTSGPFFSLSAKASSNSGSANWKSPQLQNIRALTKTLSAHA